MRAISGAQVLALNLTFALRLRLTHSAADILLQGKYFGLNDFANERAFCCMNVLKVVMCACVAAASLVGSALAQQQPQWVNQDLIAKQMQRNQYEAILRGTYAQCRLSAQDSTNQHLPMSINCSNLDQIYGVGSGESLRMCGEAHDRRPLDREQLFRDLLFGCMAKEGWLLTAQ